MINKRLLFALLLTVILYPLYLFIHLFREIDHHLQTTNYPSQVSRWFTNHLARCYLYIFGPHLNIVAC